MKLTLTSLLLGTMLFCPCFFCKLDITSAMVGLIGICATIMTIGNLYGVHKFLETHKRMADIEKEQKELLDIKEIADIQFHVAIGISNAEKAPHGCVIQIMKALSIALKSQLKDWIPQIIKVLGYVCTKAAEDTNKIQDMQRDINVQLHNIEQLDLYPNYCSDIKKALDSILNYHFKKQ